MVWMGTRSPYATGLATRPPGRNGPLAKPFDDLCSGDARHLRARSLLSVRRGHRRIRRTVVEPTFPSSCSQLTAQLAIVNGEPNSETAFDTARIQGALNACPARPGGRAASPSGTERRVRHQPITIPSGVALLVDGGVTVFASRNPADYQAAPSPARTETLRQRRHRQRLQVHQPHHRRLRLGASWATASSTAAAEDTVRQRRECRPVSWWDLRRGRQESGPNPGTKQLRPDRDRRATSATSRSTRSRCANSRRCSTSSGHGNKLHGVGREDHDALHHAEHRRHRPERHQHHHHKLAPSRTATTWSPSARAAPQPTSPSSNVQRL